MFYALSLEGLPESHRLRFSVWRLDEGRGFRVLGGGFSEPPKRLN